MTYYHGDPKYDPLFWLCLPIVLAYVAGKVALAWLKTKLPRRKAYYSCCRDCGWRLSWDAASLICPPCQEARRQKASATKLFCCDVDVEECGDAQVTGKLSENTISTTYRYRCPSCGRIWLYIKEWHVDSGNEADWYPQWTEAETAAGEPPPLFDERTRTKVYEVRP